MAKTNIYLYGALDATVADAYKAKEHLDSLGIEYTNLFYTEPSQFEQVLHPVNTWFPDEPDLTGFPFVVWDEDGVRNHAAGLKAIKAVNFQ